MVMSQVLENYSNFDDFDTLESFHGISNFKSINEADEEEERAFVFDPAHINVEILQKERLRRRQQTSEQLVG